MKRPILLVGLWLICSAEPSLGPGGVLASQPDSPWIEAHEDPRSRLIRAEPFVATAHHPGGYHFALAPSRGSWSHLVFPVARAAAIVENSPAVRMKADRADIQLVVRVVLPRAIDDRTGEPMTVLIDGDSYQRPREWSTLAVPDLAQAIDRQVRVLRSSAGSIDPREAYIDLLSIKVFGPVNGGLSEPVELWLCPPNLPHRSIPADAASTSSNPMDLARPQRAVQRCDLLEVDGRLFLPRVVRDNGEEWGFLKELGFNTIAINRAPTLTDHLEAERLGLWLVSPPPDPSISPNGAPFDRVVAWDFGADSASGELALAQLQQLRNAESKPPRPIVCCTDRPSMAGHADIRLHRRWPLGTRLELSGFEQWVRRSFSQHQGGNWLAIQTELPRELIAQASAMGVDWQRLAPEPQQIKLLSTIGAARGARGFWFDSQSRLDGDHDAAQVRAAAIKLTNQALQKIEPWLVAGEAAGEPHCAGEFQASLRRLHRATLLIVRHLPAAGQRGLVVVPTQPLEITLTGVAADAAAWQLGESLQQLPLKRTVGGLALTLEPRWHTEFVVLTRDELVIESLSRESAAQLAQQRGVRGTLTAFRQVPPPDSAELKRASIASQRCSWPLAAHRSVQISSQSLSVPSPSPGGVNLLAMGDFERAEELQSGWQFGCLPDTNGSVVVGPAAARAGFRGLQLFCPRVGPNRQPARAAHVWAVTSPIPLATRQLVCVEGFVNIPKPLGESRLVITDTLGGDPLGLEFQQTDGWTPFSMYRVSVPGDPLQLSFALTGPGTVLLDDLRVTPLGGPAEGVADLFRGGLHAH